MSYMTALKDISREGERSVTQQIIDVITTAIGSGELQPGDRLPPTREIAEIVGVNHLTAVRAYRRMREQGQVTARVGAGTFVRDPRAAEAPADALPPAVVGQHGWAGPMAHDRAVERGTIPFSVGYPPTRVLPDRIWAEHLGQATADLGPLALQYGPIEGEPALRAQLAALHDDEPDEIIVVNGAMQGLSLAARALVRPGDAVAVESPTFMGTLEVLRAAGARIVPVPVDDAGIDVDELTRLAVREDLRAVFVQSRLQNPTGADLAPDRAERLLELARRHGFFVVDDEVWAELRYSGTDPGGLRGRAPAHVIAIGSFSKTLGGGLRLGWMRASGGMLERLALAKHTDDLHSPTLTQHAAARMLAAGSYPDHLVRIRDEYRHGRDVMLEALERHLAPVATWTRPEGGACVLVTLRGDLDDRVVFTEAERAGVSIVSGSSLTAGAPAAPMVRLAYGYVDPDAIEPGVRRLAQAIRAASADRRARQAFPLS